MLIIKYILLAIIGFASGAVISGAIFAFISMIGVVPRLAARTKTVRYVKLYEDMIMVGGIFGSLHEFYKFTMFGNNFLIAVIGFAEGIFVGCLAVSLAEVIDVIPIFSRRARVKEGISFFILAIAVGKTIGSLLYYNLPGFY